MFLCRLLTVMLFFNMGWAGKIFYSNGNKILRKGKLTCYPAMMRDLFIPLGKVCEIFLPKLNVIKNSMKNFQFLIVVECVFCLVNTPGHDTGEQKNKLGLGVSGSAIPLVDNLALLTSHIRHDKRSADNSSGN